jgi:acetyltransferase
MRKPWNLFPNNPLLAILTPQNQTDPGKVAQILVKFDSKLKNISTCFMGGEKIALAKGLLAQNRISNFESPERILAVIEKLTRYQKEKNNFARINLPAYSQKENLVVEKAAGEKRKMLFWNEIKKLFSAYGVKLAKSVSFENITDVQVKKISFPCVLKTDDPRIAHRLEKKAVVLNIQNTSELKNSFEKMKKNTNAKHFLVQAMAGPGLEMIIGMKNDPTFGPVILCGWGGSFTEVFKDKIILIPPFGAKEVERKLSQLTIFPILKGFRGKRGYDLKAISKVAVATAQIAPENPQIGEIDINPLVLYNDGKEGKILDAKIFLT